MPSLDDGALDQLFRTARTYNGYVDKPVEEDQLRAIWDLMKMGPTSANMLPARIVWCVSGEAKARLASCASAKNGPKIVKAPVTAIIGMDIDFHEQLPEFFPHDQTAKSWFPDPEVRKVHALRNSSLQGGYFIMAARALGLDTGPMSGFDNARVDELFFAGTSVKSNFISTLGYGDPSTIFARSPRPAFERFNRIL
ncbi:MULTISPECIES: malonic semialdehyde reductase [Sphingomonas]|nr:MULTISPECIES: malonic semialdehyde reductase [Sphingomonas]MBA2919896.1 malonic semialdehyde reductase [Sphingomonas sp. CGMCC 1.13658]